MPFDPLDHRLPEPLPAGPGPLAPTGGHGAVLMAGVAIAALLVAGLLGFAPVLETIADAADALGL